jgi:hypothetical protein
MSGPLLRRVQHLEAGNEPIRIRVGRMTPAQLDAALAAESPKGELWRYVEDCLRQCSDVEVDLLISDPEVRLPLPHQRDV